MDRIFPPDIWTPNGAGRELTVSRCGNCHSLGPVVVGAATMGPDGLKGTVMVIHFSGYAITYGVIGTEPELQLVYDYLVKAFDGKPVPELPQAWIDKWGYY